MTSHDTRMVILSTDDVDASVDFYTRALGFVLKFRDGAHFAALDGNGITVALATDSDHPAPGRVVLGVKTADVDASVAAAIAAGGESTTAPHDGPHERRGIVRDATGNDIMFYQPLTN
ncbi:VOC family protein [Dietzia aurantiaca]|uniref:VOC family protein n=1 Tax=Dietzia aurantiaca TaxID=983873 RepID=A0ABV9PQM8_9ACTN